MSETEDKAAIFKRQMEQKTAYKQRTGTLGRGAPSPDRNLTISMFGEDHAVPGPKHERFEPVFASTMWDRPELVFDKTSKSDTSGKFLQQFIQSLQAAEEQYATQLLKVAKQCPHVPTDKFPEGKTVCAALNEIIKVTTARAQEHQRGAELLKRLVTSKVLLEADSILAEPTRNFKNSVSVASKNLKKQDELLQTKQKTSAKFKEKEISKAKSEFEAATWTKQLDPKKSTQWEALAAAQRDAEITQSMVQTVYNETLINSMNSLQTLEFQRVDILLTAISGLAEHFSRIASSTWKRALAAKGIVRAIDKTGDVKRWTQTVSSGQPCPFVGMETRNAGVSVSNAPSEAVASILAGQPVHESVPEEDAAPKFASHNPFSRVAMLKLQWQGTTKKAPQELQQQAHMDKIKFEQLQRKKKMQDDLRAQRKREEQARIQAEQQEREHADKEREAQIKQLLAEKEAAEKEKSTLEDELRARGAEEQQRQLEEQARLRAEKEQAEKEREDQLKQLLQEREQSQKEKDELVQLLRQKEAEAIAEHQKAEEVKRALQDATKGTHRSTGSVIPRQMTGGLGRRTSEFGGDGALKTPIILDNGSAFLKIGFAGQESPSLVVPSVVATFPHPLSKHDPTFADQLSTAVGATAQHLALANVPETRVNTQVFKDQPQSWDDLEVVWSYLFDQLGVDIREHPLLVTQPVMSPLTLKFNMSQMFFEKFQVPALYVASSPLLAAYSYGASSGLVVDVGHSSAQIVPLIDGYMLEPQVRRSYHLGGYNTTVRLQDFLQQKDLQRLNKTNPSTGGGARGRTASRVGAEGTVPEGEVSMSGLAHSWVMASNIKDRLAFCVPSDDDYSNLMDVLETVKGFVGRPDADPDDDEEPTDLRQEVDPAQTTPLELQSELVKAGEVMFQPKSILNDLDGSIVSIPEMIADVVSRCDIDTRVTLLSNIFLAGGVATMPGFGARLEKELKAIIPHAQFHLRVVNQGSRYASWVGGSVLTSLEAFQDSWIFKEEWDEAKEIAEAEERAEKASQTTT